MMLLSPFLRRRLGLDALNSHSTADSRASCAGVVKWARIERDGHRARHVSKM
jgi:hypothetical protein